MNTFSEFFERNKISVGAVKVVAAIAVLVASALVVNYLIEKIQDNDSQIIKQRVENLKNQIETSQKLADSFNASADQIAATRKSIEKEIGEIDKELDAAKTRDEQLATSISQVKKSYDAARYAQPNFENKEKTESKNNDSKSNKPNFSRRSSNDGLSLSERERRALSADERLYPSTAKSD